MTTPLLALQRIALTLGGRPLIASADLAVARGERVCLVGRNGSGKSTLLRIAAGTVAADDGTRFVQPGARVAVLEQEPDLTRFATAIDAAAAELAPEDGDHQARAVLDALAIGTDRPVATMSGGERRRVALARAIAPAPDVLLLDEPTNHLDLPAIEWLELFLAGATASAIVVISHDRRLLERVSTATVWLDEGHTARLDRSFAFFEDWRDERVAAETERRRLLDRAIAREEDWMRYGVTARRKRNVRRVAELAAMRAERRDALARPGTARLASEHAGTSGRLVAVAEHVTHAAAVDAPVLVRDLSLRLLRGDRLGIAGPNGAGKTTLLGLLTGLIEPREGAITVGASLAVATLDQLRATLDPDATLATTLAGGSGETVLINGERRHVVGVMKDFLFRPEQARTPVGALSGGERGRLALAIALIRPSNLLVLDEPTNDLDLETLDLLAELLGTYAGTVLLVSHDRDFLDRVATSLLLAEGGGRWVEYAGGWTDMLAQRNGRSPFAAAEPVNGKRDSATARNGNPNPGPRRPGKLTFKDSHLLATLPARMDAGAVEIARLEALIADPDLFRRDPARFNDAIARLARTRAQLAADEDSWLELELRREATDP